MKAMQTGSEKQQLQIIGQKVRNETDAYPKIFGNEWRRGDCKISEGYIDKKNDNVGQIADNLPGQVFLPSEQAMIEEEGRQHRYAEFL